MESAARESRSAGLRLAMVTTFYPPHHFGGDAISLRRLVDALARRGHTAEVICDVDAFRLLNGRAPREASSDSGPDATRVHRLHSRLGPLSTIATQQTGRPIFQGRRIRRILRDGRFDVIHFHNISLVGGPGILAYGNAIKLYTAHEHWLVCPTHTLWRHARELCTRRQCFRCVLRHHRPPQLWRHTGLLERSSRHIDVFTSPSRFSADKHAELGFPRELTVLPYFLPDPESEAEQPVGVPDLPTRPFFLFVGRLEQIKGLQDLLPLFADDTSEDLWIVGTGQYEGELRQLAAGNPRIRFLGARTPGELRSLYARALALLVPSLCYETFGIVILEAFRERTPVVARRLGPFPEIVERSGGGMLFETTDQLRAILRRISADQQLRAELGRNGHEALRAHWSEGVVLKQYLSLIEQAARRRGDQHIVKMLGGGS